MSAHERAFRWLLAAYPAEFRARYGREMELAFRDLYRAAAGRTTRLWLETLVDVARSALALRIDAARARAGELTHATEGTMKIMAMVTMLAGAVVTASAAFEGWAGGVVRHDAASALAGALGIVAGLLLVGAGIAILRAARSAAFGARAAAVGCLLAFVGVTAAGRMSVFTLLLGFGMPLLLLIVLSRGGRTPAVAA